MCQQLAALKQANSDLIKNNKAEKTRFDELTQSYTRLAQSHNELLNRIDLINAEKESLKHQMDEIFQKPKNPVKSHAPTQNSYSSLADMCIPPPANPSSVTSAPPMQHPQVNVPPPSNPSPLTSAHPTAQMQRPQVYVPNVSTSNSYSTGLISKAVKTYFDRKAVKTRLKPVETGLNRSKRGQNLKLRNMCQGL